VPGLTSESIIPKQCKAAGIELHELFEDLLNEAMIKNS
jgi:D-alanine-D-alanine ligase-like ATP-grasp enzyme